MNNAKSNIASSRQAQPHLSEDDLTNHLIDPDHESPAALHLAACTDCHARLEAFEASMGSFSSLTLAWSEQRSITMPLRPERGSAPRWVPSTMPAWSAVIAAALLLAVVIPADLHIKAREAQTQAEVGVDPDSDAQIAQDNQLMRAVSLEINRREPSPLVANNESTQRSTPGAKHRLEVSSE